MSDIRYLLVFIFVDCKLKELTNPKTPCFLYIFSRLDANLEYFRP